MNVTLTLGINYERMRTVLHSTLRFIVYRCGQRQTREEESKDEFNEMEWISQMQAKATK